MRKLPSLPPVSVLPDQVVLDGGLDLISPPGMAAPGTARFALNYELEFGGGYQRVGGYERFDGRARPSDATYVVLEASEGFDVISAGSLVVGATSGAQGTLVWQSDDLTRIALTKLLPGFSFTTEVVTVGASPVGTVTLPAPSIDAFIDNDIAYLAAEEYRKVITKPPGVGPVRGVAIIANSLFAVRDYDVGEQRIWKATTTGWQQVNLLRRVDFNAGTAEYVDGDTLVQGAVSALIRRVVVKTGTFAAGTAEGFFVINAPTGGNFVAAAAAGDGACTLLGADSAQVRIAGGKLDSVAFNFTGSAATRRLYCCDGVNTEFEFDGEVYVPIETGMNPVRASRVFCHKNQLFFAYGASLQHSGIGEPYKWSPIFGAAELTTGDTITNLINVSGSESNAALMVTCKDSVWVLYGSSAADWKFTRVSDTAGAQMYSGAEMGNSISFDREGFVRYSPTQSFGNFSYESASRLIDPLVRNATVKCSVLVNNRSKYRCFFSDGLFVTATPTRRGLAWMPCDYGRVMNVVVGGEINGAYRIFMGSEDGWVFEADVGRSFDGEEIEASLRLSSLIQRSSVTEKHYRHMFLKTEAASAFELAVGAEYSDGDPDLAAITVSEFASYKKQYGAGLFWDFGKWDRAYWDQGSVNNIRYEIDGNGLSLSLLFSSRSDRELPHMLKIATIMYTPRRLGR